MSLSPAEWAWVAGIIEGEGTIQFTGKTGVRVVVAMTDRDVIDTLERRFPTSTGVREWVDPTREVLPRYEWTVGSRDAVLMLLDGIGPWMHARRLARMTDARERLKKNRGLRSARTHCPAGHPLFGDNLYVAPNGWRQCNECRDHHRGRAAA